MRAICCKKGFDLFELGDDHVHMFVDITPNFSVSDAFQALKGISSKHLRKCFPALVNHYYWKGGLWSRGKFFRSVGNVTAEVIEAYINQQNDPKRKLDFKAYILKAKLKQRRMKTQKSLVGFCAQ